MSTWKDTLDKLKEAQAAVQHLSGQDALEVEELNRVVLKLERQMAFESFDPLAQITEIPHADLSALHANIEALKATGGNVNAGHGGTVKTILGNIVGLAGKLIIPGLG